MSQHPRILARFPQFALVIVFLAWTQTPLAGQPAEKKSAAVYRIHTDNGELVITTDHPDVEVIVRDAGKLVRIMDRKTGKELKLEGGLFEMELKGQAEGLKLSLDKATLRRGQTVLAAITRTSKAIVAEPPAKPELLHTIDWQDFDQGFPAHVFQTGISDDGKLFFGAGDSGFGGLVRIFEVKTGREVRVLSPGAQVGVLKFSTAAFVPRGKLIAAYHNEADIYLWDIASGKIVHKLTGHKDLGVGTAVSPDGKRLLSWSDDLTLRLWDLETGKELRQLLGHTNKTSGAFSPDGKKILTFSLDKTLRLWDVSTGKALMILQGHDGPCSGSFSPDGTQVLSFSDDRTIRLWDVESGKEIRRLEEAVVKDGDRGFITGGRQVAAYCDDQIYRIWDTASGKIIREINLAQMGGDRWSMTASPDGRLGLVNHEDGSVRVFDLATGQQIHRYDNCTKARAFSFTPDGNFAVSGSFRAGLRVYRLPGATGSRE